MIRDLQNLTRDQSRATWTVGGDDDVSYDGQARAVVVKATNPHDVPESFTGPWVRIDVIDVLDMVIAAELPDELLRALRDRPNATVRLRLPELAGVCVFHDVKRGKDGLERYGSTGSVECVEITGTLRALNDGSQMYTLTPSPSSDTPRWLIGA